MAKIINIIELENDMIEVHREDGQVTVMSRRGYDLANALTALIKETDPEVVQWAARHAAGQDDVHSKLIHGVSSIYLKHNHPELL